MDQNLSLYQKLEFFSMKYFFKIFTTVFFFFFINGCQVDGEINYSKDIKIGFIAPLTGPVADLGAEMFNSAKLAIEHSKEQFPNINFVLLAQDDGMNATQAATKAKSLVDQDGSLVLIGAGTTGQVKAEISAIKGRNIPLITPTATESDLTELGNFIFRVIPSNRAQAETIVEFLSKKGIKNVGIVFQLNDDYSIDLKGEFKNLFSNSDNQVLLEVGFESDETDFKAQLSKMKNMKVDGIICFAQHVQVSRVVLRARELNIIAPIFSGETAYTDKLIETVGSANELYVTGATTEKSLEREQFEKKYFAKFGKRPGPYGIYAYDAIQVAMHTIANKRPSNGIELIEYLKDIQNYSGISGEIKFNKYGDVEKKYDIFRLEEKSFRKTE